MRSGFTPSTPPPPTSPPPRQPPRHLPRPRFVSPRHPLPPPLPPPPHSPPSPLPPTPQSAVRGGTAGAVAMFCNVGALMWMRTTINYQYRNGGTFPQALKTLYADGGVPRFYRGVLPALVQGPLSRFGDTAANTGIMTMFDSYEVRKRQTGNLEERSVRYRGRLHSSKQTVHITYYILHPPLTQSPISLIFYSGADNFLVTSRPSVLALALPHFVFSSCPSTLARQPCRFKVQ